MEALSVAEAAAKWNARAPGVHRMSQICQCRDRKCSVHGVYACTNNAEFRLDGDRGTHIVICTPCLSATYALMANSEPAR